VPRPSACYRHCLPTRPMTRLPAKPMNQASRCCWLVPVLPKAGIGNRVARPEPLRTSGDSKLSHTFSPWQASKDPLREEVRPTGGLAQRRDRGGAPGLDPIDARRNRGIGRRHFEARSVSTRTDCKAGLGRYRRGNPGIAPPSDGSIAPRPFGHLHSNCAYGRGEGLSGRPLPQRPAAKTLRSPAADEYRLIR